jgi:alkylation response protein AidB-like acyl-CoA dehydrogenase
MDFGLTEEQRAIQELAAKILDDNTAPETIRAVEDGETPGLDKDLWAKLAEAGLLGVCVPEADNGLGLGFVETALLLIEAGRTVAPVPLLSHIVGSALPLARFGSDDQRSQWLRPAAQGEVILAAALAEPLGDPATPAMTATPTGDGWRLEGTKSGVAGGLYADRMLVSASTPDGAALFLLDPSDPGVTLARQDTIAYTAEAVVSLDGVEVGADALVGPTDGSALAWTLNRVTCGGAALLVGVTEQAVALTAEYVKTREQFDHPIAMFQAVGQRAADARIDSQVIRLTTLLAAWRLSADLDADKEVAVAKFYASEGGQRVVRGAAHLHGGMGVSREYPLHRYYVWAKQLELGLGGTHVSLARLGRLLADEPVTV